MEKIARFRGDVGDVSRPYRHRQQHDVHGREAGNCETSRKSTCFSGLFLFGTQRHKGMAVVAAFFQRFENLRGFHRTVGPGHVQPAIGEIEPRFGHTRKTFNRIFDTADARATGDAIDRKLHAERAVAGGLGVKREVKCFSHSKISC